jgi:hypothetical protein
MNLLAEANPVRVESLAPMGYPARGGRPRTRLILVAATAVLVAGVAAAISVFVFSDASTKRGGSPNPAAVRPAQLTLGVNPFGASGKVVTLQQLVADKASDGWNVPLPDSPLANSNNVGSVWENTFTGGSAVYYPSSGIELWYGGTGIDTTGLPTNAVQTIDGVEVLVFPAGVVDKYAEVSAPLPGNHAVTLYSLGPISDLITVAQSIVDRSK